MIFYDDFRQALPWYAADVGGQPSPLAKTIPWDPAALQRIHQSREPLALDLPYADGTPQSNGDGSLLGHGFRSACLLPLATAQRRLGAILFASKLSGYFSSEIRDFLWLAADQITIALDNAFNFTASQLARARLESETAKLQLLLDLNNAIVSDLKLSRLLETISPCIRGLMRVDAVALILPESGSDRLRLHALNFPESKQALPLGRKAQRPSSIAEQIFRTGEPWMDSLQSLENGGKRDPAVIAGLRTVCGLPLKRRNRVLGVLGFGRIEEAAFDHVDLEFLMQVANQVSIAVENALVYGELAETQHQLLEEKLYLEDELRSELKWQEIVGSSAAMRQVLQHVETVAPTATSVLICGETGTGKELIARAIHNLSPRVAGAFVKVNCAALPVGLLESELFGHEKGSFTGASAQRQGRFHIADRGTIFLDEIGELPLELQPKLLRVLQEGEFERVGSSRTLRTDARIIAATNRDLKGMVARGEFRADLFYRLNVFPVQLPALCSRPEDIPPLVRHFSSHFARRLNKPLRSVSSATTRWLTAYPRPGNIRELQNVIERAVILCTGAELDIPPAERIPARQEHPSRLDQIEREHILRVLEQTHWSSAVLTARPLVLD